ncbi:46 kDa FK506-binding nuclear protein [Melanaphis sacchari]|nr:46 kDa FK506-binding nuclear protein [Melanaphis sacchari]
MWSIVMEPGKKYSTVVENTFHLSMATLDLETVKKADDVHTVYVETDDNPRVILCHLSKASKLFQCRLDHIFPRGTDLKFVTSATANIHMTGYLDLNEDDELYSDLESDSEDEGTQIEEKPTQGKGNKRKSEDNTSKKNKSIKLDKSNQFDKDSDDENETDDETMDFEDDSDDDDNEGLTLSDLADDDDDDDDEEDDDEDDDVDDDDDEDEEDDEDETEDIPVLTKKTKEQQKTPKKQLNGNDIKTPKKEQMTPKGQKTPLPKTPKTPKTPDANQTLVNGSTESSKKNKNKDPKAPLSGLKTKPDTPLPKDKQNQQQKLNGGVIINDIKVGDGAVAKPGKNVKVYYIGRLKSTGKVFDSMQKGPGFTFGLQRGEVIKGWDIGIAGMKVGGKRKVICPPNMAYGAKGSPPEIPPNSTLVFDVELKHVN